MSTWGSQLWLWRAIILIAMAGTVAVLLSQRVDAADDVAGASVRAPLVAAKTSESSAKAADNRGSEEASYQLDSGDQLKLAIFGRPDLSGDYRVNDSGDIRIPQLGEFHVAKLSVAEAERRLQDVLDDIVGRKTFLTLDIVERRPVFVLGGVGKPGAYPHRSGMLVLHALSLAGGVTRFGAGTLLGVETAREKSKLDEFSSSLSRLHATRARLIAEKEGQSEVAATPDLVQLVGKVKATELVAAETKVLERQRSLTDRMKTSLNATIKHDESEIEALNAQLQSLKEQRKLRAQQLEEIKKISEARLATLQRLTDLQISVALVDNQIQDATVALSRAQSNCEKNRKELEFVDLQRNAAIETEMIDVGEKIEKTESSVRGARIVIAQMTGSLAAAVDGSIDGAQSYEIVRTNLKGEVEVQKAGELSPLLPGDILKVNTSAFSQ